MEESKVEALWVRNHSDLVKVAEEMIQQDMIHFDKMKEIHSELDESNLKVEEIDGLKRVKGRVRSLDKYNRFITFDGETPIQLTYIKYIHEEFPDGIAQLNIVGPPNEEMPIDRALHIVSAFFDMTENIIPMVPNAPSHVKIYAQKLKPKGEKNAIDSAEANLG